MILIAGLTTLVERRERGDAIETFKTLNGFNKVKKEKWFRMEEENRRPTRQNAEATDEGVKKREMCYKRKRRDWKLGGTSIM